MPEQWDDDGQGHGGDAFDGRERGSEADERDAEADTREAAADRREFQIDARELVLDRWEREIAAQAAALGLLDEQEDQQRERRRRERMSEGQARRDQAEARRLAAIERDVRRAERSGPHHPPGVPGLQLPPSFGVLSAAMTGDVPLAELFGLVLEAVAESVAGCAGATVTLATQERIEVAATTSPWAAELDEHQVARSCGPVLEAIVGRRVVSADLGSDLRWPALADVAQAQGRAVMSFGLRAGRRQAGALTVYSGRGGRLGPEAVTVGEFLGAQAVVVLDRSLERLSYEAQAQAWHSALSSRDAIGQAKGMLMEQRSISGEEAFDILRELSQRLNRKVRDIAIHLIERRQLPLR